MINNDLIQITSLEEGKGELPNAVCLIMMIIRMCWLFIVQFVIMLNEKESTAITIYNNMKQLFPRTGK